MRLILDLFRRIFEALSSIYTKAETDAQLAERDSRIANAEENIGLNAEAIEQLDTALEAEEAAREQADTALGERISTGESNLSRAELIEKWRDKTYCELVITKVNGYNTSRLPRIEASGIWWIDLDDGNGAQMRIEDNVQIEFEWGAQTEKKIVIYGAITALGFNVEDVDGNYRYVNKEFYLVSKTLTKLHRIFVFSRSGLVADISVDSQGFTTTEIMGKTTDKYANWSFTQGAYDSIRYFFRNAGVLGSLSNGVSGNMLTVDCDSYPNIGGVNGITTSIGEFYVSVSVDHNYPAGLGNMSKQKLLRYKNLKLVATTRSFGLTSLTDFIGYMPNLSDAPSLFVESPLNTVSVLGVLNKLKRYTDGGTHRIGFTVTNKPTAGIVSEATTETFTVADSDGTEYSVENCPRFINDDADSSLRKAYVLAIAKKGWEVII